MSREPDAQPGAEKQDASLSRGGPLPQVDGVVLSWERASHTVAAINSLLGQDGVDVRVVVVDQGSSEACRAHLAEAFRHEPRVLLHQLERNLGVPGGRNVGLALCDAEIVVFLDNDAVFERTDSLQRVMKRFVSEPDLAVISFLVLRADTRDLDRLSWPHLRGLQERANQEFFTTRFAGGAFACRREVFNAAGGFDDALEFGWEEADLGHRIVRLNKKLLHDPKVVVFHAVSSEKRDSWQRGRYRRYVRNRLYYEMKYNGPTVRVVYFFLGYLMKGVINRMPAVAITALAESMQMIRRHRTTPGLALPPMNSAAQAYIAAHEAPFEGKWWVRLRRDVLSRLEQ